MLSLFSRTLSVLVGVLHGYFFYLETFRWTAPRTLQTFGNTLEQAQQSMLLAANQGVYNAMLGLGIIVGTLLPGQGLLLRRYLLVFVIVAGVYGAATVTTRILWVQATPAVIALALTFVESRSGRTLG